PLHPRSRSYPLSLHDALPISPLKQLQRRILRRLLAKLKTHPACQGFEPGRSILTNALPHASRRTVIRLDIQDFFTSTTARRVERSEEHTSELQSRENLVCRLL